MPRMVDDPGVLGDHLRDPGQRPQVVREPAGPRPGEQDLLDLRELLKRHPGRRSGCTPAAQRLLATLPPPAIPAAHVLPAHAQLAGDLGLGHLTSEQPGRCQPDPLLGVTVTGRAPAHPATALLGRHDPSSHNRHEHVALSSEPL